MSNQDLSGSTVTPIHHAGIYPVFDLDSQPSMHFDTADGSDEWTPITQEMLSRWLTSYAVPESDERAYDLLHAGYNTTAKIRNLDADEPALKGFTRADSKELGLTQTLALTRTLTLIAECKAVLRLVHAGDPHLLQRISQLEPQLSL